LHHTRFYIRHPIACNAKCASPIRAAQSYLEISLVEEDEKTGEDCGEASEAALHAGCSASVCRTSVRRRAGGSAASGSVRCGAVSSSLVWCDAGPGGSSSAASRDNCHGGGNGGISSSRKASVGGADARIDQVLEPGTRVKLAVDVVDEVGVLAARRRRHDVHGDDTNDRLRVWDRSSVGGHPADYDGVARVPDVELLEVDLRLLALADLELLEA